jgi:uncharacterized membrane-anchored protein YhcB (DUF1043 family)
MQVALVALPLVALGIGVLIGRRSSDAAERARTLAAELDAQRAELERVQVEKHAVLDELQQARDEAASYRGRVVSHFYGTSEQLRALTLRYRELFEHLADGARELCPEASSALQAGLEAPALPAPEVAAAAPEAAAAEPEAAAEEPAEEEARRVGEAAG